MNFYKAETPKPFYLHEDSIDSHPELTNNNAFGNTVPFYMKTEARGSPPKVDNYNDLIYPLSASSMIKGVHFQPAATKYDFQKQEATEESRLAEGFWNDSYVDPLSYEKPLETNEILRSFKNPAIENNPELTLGFPSKRPNFNYQKENDEEDFWEKFNNESKAFKKQNSSNPKQDQFIVSDSEHKYLGEIKIRCFPNLEETSKFISHIVPHNESHFDDFEDKKCYFSSQMECLLFLDDTQFQLKVHVPDVQDTLLAVFEGFEDFFVLVLWESDDDIIVVHTPKLYFYDFIEEKFEEFGIEIKIVSSSDLLSKRLSDLEERIQLEFQLNESVKNPPYPLKESNMSLPIGPVSHRSENNLIQEEVKPKIENKENAEKPGSDKDLNFEVKLSSESEKKIPQQSSDSSMISDNSSQHENQPQFKMEQSEMINIPSQRTDKEEDMRLNSTYRVPKANINFDQPSQRTSERFIQPQNNLSQKRNTQLEGIMSSTRARVIDPDDFDPMAYKEYLRIQREEEARMIEMEQARVKAEQEERERIEAEEKRKLEAAERARIEELKRIEEEEELEMLRKQQELLDEESRRKREIESNSQPQIVNPEENSMSFGNKTQVQLGNSQALQHEEEKGEEETMEKKMEEALRKSMEEEKERKKEEDKKAEIDARRREEEEAQREAERLRRMKVKFGEAVKFLSTGHEFLKYGYKNVRSPNKRFIHFSEDMINFFWNNSLKKKIPKNSAKIYSTTDILDVLDGRTSMNFKRFKPKSKQAEILSFSLIIKGRSIDLEAKNYDEKCNFIESVKTISHVLKDEDLYERIILSGT